MSLVDSHCHLNHPKLAADLNDVLCRAGLAGVSRMVVVGYDLSSSREAVSLANAHPSVLAAVGVHPHEADQYDSRAADALAELARGDRVVAYGEVGLDYHYDHSPRPIQRATFERQLDEAARLGLPVIIHSREAADDTRAILSDYAPLAAGGVMHCYPYGADQVDWVLEMGLHIGLTGIVTFPKGEEARQVAACVPLDRLLIETDAPYLAPVPYRGRTNEPAYVSIVAEAIGRVRGVDASEIAATTTRNAGKLFGELIYA